MQTGIKHPKTLSTEDMPSDNSKDDGNDNGNGWENI
jgi:hypothetical protein